MDVIGIGAPKAGTTWLVECMREHPRIAVSRRKETHYFTEHFARGTEWYRNMFEDNQRTRLECSTDYLYDPRVPERIRNTAPNARVFLCIRDPLERAISEAMHWNRNGVWSLKAQSHLEPVGNPIERSHYSRYLARFAEVLGPDRIHVAVIEKAWTAPSAALDDIYRFAGVPPAPLPRVAKRVIGKGTVPRSTSVEQIRRLVYRILNRGITARVVGAIRRSGISEVVKQANASSEAETELRLELVRRWGPRADQLKRQESDYFIKHWGLEPENFDVWFRT